MSTPGSSRAIRRYSDEDALKSNGVTYTPKQLSDFVASELLATLVTSQQYNKLRILDPAVGHGELLYSLLEKLKSFSIKEIEVYGFDIDDDALEIARSRLEESYPNVHLSLIHENFLDYSLSSFSANLQQKGLFDSPEPPYFDLIIANPPYVRTQIMGAKQTKEIATRFGLSGKIDLYHAFVLAMSLVLKPSGAAGIIVSNRFMTTKSGGALREAIKERFNIHHIWDMGDSRLFKAAVLPAVLLLKGRETPRTTAKFTSIYESNKTSKKIVSEVIEALSENGLVSLQDGRTFHVQNGILSVSSDKNAVWRLATSEYEEWLLSVSNKTWGTFKDLGSIRVGVKSCADKIFIRDNWNDIPGFKTPELLKPLTTHKVARQYKADLQKGLKYVLYPHTISNGQRRAINLSDYPNSREYLESNRVKLESRTYLMESGRSWYELWVPHNPDTWSNPKLVFRDISEKPTFWVDLEGTIVNGDCYWISLDAPEKEDLLWLACAVANSSFIEKFYDCNFNNKLYSGRRRFITQYVEKFPLPDPGLKISKMIIKKAKTIYESTPSKRANALVEEVNELVWQAFS